MISHKDMHQTTKRRCEVLSTFVYQIRSVCVDYLHAQLPKCIPQAIGGNQLFLASCELGRMSFDLHFRLSDQTITRATLAITGCSSEIDFVIQSKQLGMNANARCIHG